MFYLFKLVRNKLLKETSEILYLKLNLKRGIKKRTFKTEKSMKFLAMAVKLYLSRISLHSLELFQTTVFQNTSVPKGNLHSEMKYFAKGVYRFKRNQ